MLVTDKNTTDKTARGFCWNTHALRLTPINIYCRRLRIHKWKYYFVFITQFLLTMNVIELIKISIDGLWLFHSSIAYNVEIAKFTHKITPTQ